MLLFVFLGVGIVIALIVYVASMGDNRRSRSSFLSGDDSPSVDVDHSSHATHHSDTSSHASHDASHSDSGGSHHH